MNFLYFSKRIVVFGLLGYIMLYPSSINHAKCQKNPTLCIPDLVRPPVCPALSIQSFQRELPKASGSAPPVVFFTSGTLPRSFFRLSRKPSNVTDPQKTIILVIHRYRQSVHPRQLKAAELAQGVRQGGQGILTDLQLPVRIERIDAQGVRSRLWPWRP